MPAVRDIVRQAQREDLRFSALVLGVAQSAQFRQRMKAPPGHASEAWPVHHPPPSVTPRTAARCGHDRWHCRCWNRWCRRCPPYPRRTCASAQSIFRTAPPCRAGRRRMTGRISPSARSSSRWSRFARRSTSCRTWAMPLAYGPGGATGNHNRSSATFLSGARAAAGAQPRLGITMDQVAVKHLGQDTPLPSLELMIEEASLSCGEGLSCAYRNTLSWQRRNVAAADAEQSAGAVRAAVRRWRDRRAACGATRAGAEPAGFGHRTDPRP